MWCIYAIKNKKKLGDSDFSSDTSDTGDTHQEKLLSA